MKIFDFEEHLEKRVRNVMAHKLLDEIASARKKQEEMAAFRQEMGLEDSEVANFNDINLNDAIKETERNFEEILRSLGMKD